MHLTEEKLEPKTHPEVLVVGGGKGGVGKTCFSVNAAVEIAKRGWRVVLMDADLSCSNVETVLGIRNSAQRLDDFFLQAGQKSLASIVQETEYANLRLIAGTSGLLDAANPRFQQ
ncbi:MAG: P-loop NTPase, partial [Candidatus Hydrogenedentes bacterium]|nr:P-loop NTPase [Candidatus Hydrogenedentota bacterium]